MGKPPSADPSSATPKYGDRRRKYLPCDVIVCAHLLSLGTAHKTTRQQIQTRERRARDTAPATVRPNIRSDIASQRKGHAMHREITNTCPHRTKPTVDAQPQCQPFPHVTEI